MGNKRRHRNYSAKNGNEKRIKEDHYHETKTSPYSDLSSTESAYTPPTKNQSVDSLIEANMRKFELYSTPVQVQSKVISKSPSRINTSKREHTKQKHNCDYDQDRSIKVDLSTSSISPQTTSRSSSRTSNRTSFLKQRSASTGRKTIAPLMALTATLPTSSGIRSGKNAFTSNSKEHLCDWCKGPPCSYVPVNDRRLCWYCGHLGHHMKECDNSKLHFCRICGRIGYDTQFCPCSRI